MVILNSGVSGSDQSFRSLALVCALTTVLLPFVSGCGGAGGGKGKPVSRAVASGSVTLDGQPVASGAISFTHKESGIPALCIIADGKYTSEAGKGPQIGLNMASLSSKAPDGTLIWSTLAPQEVAVDDAKYVKDFQITSAQVKKATGPAKAVKPGEKVWPGDEI